MQQLLGGPRAVLADSLGVVAATALVEDALSLRYGTKVRHGVRVLDNSNAPVDATVDVEDGEVVWAYRPPDRVDGKQNETAEVRRTGTLSVGPTSLALEAFRYQPWTELQASDGTWVPFNLGVLIPENPRKQDDGLVVRRTLRLADLTLRLRRELPETIVVASTENPVEYVIESLGDEFGETSFSIPASTVTLTEAKVFTPPLTWLDVYNALLETAAYDQLTYDEEGRPRSVPLADLAGRGPEWRYGPGEKKIVVAGSVEPLLPTLPNVVRFIARQGPSLPEEGNGYTTVRNQSTGPSSIDALGEERWVRVEVDAEDQAELDAIAAAEAQRYFAGGGLRFQGQVGLNPLHSDRDVIALTKPRLDLSGTWLVTEWRYPMKPVTGQDAVLMPITCERRV